MSETDALEALAALAEVIHIGDLDCEIPEEHGAQAAALLRDRGWQLTRVGDEERLRAKIKQLVEDAVAARAAPQPPSPASQGEGAMSRKHNGDFPKLPSECKRHRPVDEEIFATGEPTGRVRCWHCGAVLQAPEPSR